MSINQTSVYIHIQRERSKQERNSRLMPDMNCLLKHLTRVSDRLLLFVAFFMD